MLHLKGFNGREYLQKECLRALIAEVCAKPCPIYANIDFCFFFQPQQPFLRKLSRCGLVVMSRIGRISHYVIKDLFEFKLCLNLFQRSIAFYNSIYYSIYDLLFRMLINHFGFLIIRNSYTFLYCKEWQRNKIAHLFV